MKKIISIVVIVNIFLSGCSAFVPKTEALNINCSEEDATLQVNGQMYKGSAQPEVERNKPVAIMCTKPGFYPAQKTIDKSLSGTGIADIVGTFIFLLPGIGLFTPGAWTLNEDFADVQMVKKEQK